MGRGPAPFSDIGKRAKGLLTKDYNFDHKFTLSIPSSSGTVLTATGLKRDQIFVGDISMRYKSRSTTVDVKVDTYSNVSTKVTVNDMLPCTKATFSFNTRNSKSSKVTATGLKRDQSFVGNISMQYKSRKTTVDVKVDTYSNVSTKVTVNDMLPCTKATFSFNTPNNKSSKLDVQYLHNHAAINSSIGLNPAPLLELAAVLGDKDLSFGGEFGFDTASSSFTKYNVGVSFNKTDFSAALILANKGQTMKASYIHSVNPMRGTEVAAEMTHQFSTYKNTFTIGSSHTVDPYTTVKTKFSNNGKVSMLCQRKWRPKSLITLSAEYNSNALYATPKLGLALALRP